MCIMSKKRSLIDEFWEDASPPVDTEKVMKEFFGEFAEFIDPKTYGGDGILKSIVKLFADLIK